ncbi:MAG: aldo/keto reductase [Planctomycetota bacterium]
MTSNDPTPYQASDTRYDNRPNDWFRRAGDSGLKLPAVSLGMWHNFGNQNVQDPAAYHHNARTIVRTAFEYGITHFDLANNYGPPPGSAETRFGQILKQDLAAYRDELIISTKAGFDMWAGPYGEFGSRKHLLASLDQSLKRLGVDYVDIFYSHRYDKDTPLEETCGALEQAVRSGKALYSAISNYPGEPTRRSLEINTEHDYSRPILHQSRYNLFDRWIERGQPDQSVLDICGDQGLGLICFSPLDQGLLTNKYLEGIPEDSRANSSAGVLQKEGVSTEKVEAARSLNNLARQSGRTLAQFALRWVVHDPRITSALIGASRPEQVIGCCRAFESNPLTVEEIKAAEDICMPIIGSARN